jgi:hypothetical protein
VLWPRSPREKSARSQASRPSQRASTKDDGRSNYRLRGLRAVFPQRYLREKLVARGISPLGVFRHQRQLAQREPRSGHPADRLAVQGIRQSRIHPFRCVVSFATHAERSGALRKGQKRAATRFHRSVPVRGNWGKTRVLRAS